MATFDVHPNFAYSTVATAPSPATSGTSLVVASGDGALFATTPPFNAVIWPIGSQPTSTNAEIVRVTARSTDTLTITRAQEGTAARTVVVGDQIAVISSKKTFTDLETAINAHTHVSGDGGVLTYAGLPNGAIIQSVSTNTGAMATGTTVIPYDDTIPQNTEGDQYMSLAITPKLATSTLVIHVLAQLASSATGAMTAALFQDSTANALAASSMVIANAGNPYPISLLHQMTSGTTSATTFKVRAGSLAAGTTTFNGVGGARRFGGVSASSIVIYEVKG